VVTPGQEEEDPANRLLFVAGSGSSPSSRDQAKIDLFESWGYTVTVIDDYAGSSSISSAVAENDVVYISEECSASAVDDDYRDVTIGVVNEEGRVTDEFGLTSSSSNTTDYSSYFNVINSGHEITSGYSGWVQVFSSSQDVRETGGGSTASGVVVLTEESGGGSDASLMVADAGAPLYSGSAAGRRVMFPAGDDFDVTRLNSDGETILRRCIAWAAGGGASGQSGLATRWFDLSNSPRELGAVDWAAEPAMFSVSRVEVRLDTWSLLGGPVRVLELVVDQPALYLERREDGSANWEFAGSDDEEGDADPEPGESGGGFLLRQVDISNGRVRLLSPGRDGPTRNRVGGSASAGAHRRSRRARSPPRTHHRR